MTANLVDVNGVNHRRYVIWEGCIRMLKGMSVTNLMAARLKNMPHPKPFENEKYSSKTFLSLTELIYIWVMVDWEVQIRSERRIEIHTEVAPGT